MTAPTITWRLVAGDETLASGQSRYEHRPYCTCPAEEVEIAVPAVSHARAARLEASLREGDRTVTNSWNVWVFPPKAALPPSVRRFAAPQNTWLKDWDEIPQASPEEIGREELDGRNAVVLTERLDERLVAFMRGGGRVILAASGGLVRTHGPMLGSMSYFFTPPANFPPYEEGQNGTIILDHPALGDFPHEGFADLQFFRLMDKSPHLDLARLDLAQSDPVIRVIHRYPVCSPLAYLLERSLGKGGLIISALDLNPSWPEARYLLTQFCVYAGSNRFHPSIELSDTALQHIMKYTAVP
jgi:beta-galactosidase